MAFPNKEMRENCWASRDAYWDCLASIAPDFQSTSGAEEPKECVKLRKLFISSCPNQWVKHFDRKRTYEQFKKKMERGYDPTEQAKESS